MSRLHRLNSLFVIALLLVVPSCGSDSPTDPPESGVVEIQLLDQSFSRSQLTIEPGTTVRWVNQGNIDHTVTPDGHNEWQRATFSDEGDTFEHTFETEGEFPYFCEPHQSLGMVGTIVVES